MNMPEKPAIKTARKTRILEVLRSTRLTPSMQRVTLGGTDLSGFPPGQEGNYIKLMIPPAGTSMVNFRTALENGDKNAPRRTYTVRHHRPADNELDVDFVVHEGGGPACNWALAAQSGDCVGVGGPGPIKFPDHKAGWFLFGADMSALPAAAAALENLPKNAVGHALFEITCEDDIQEVNAPEGIEIHWLIHDHPHTSSTQQLDLFKALTWPDATPGVFVAGEFTAVAGLRAYLLDEKGLDKRSIYVSSYWKIGLVEDEHRIAKNS